MLLLAIFDIKIFCGQNNYTRRENSISSMYNPKNFVQKSNN